MTVVFMKSRVEEEAIRKVDPDSKLPNHESPLLPPFDLIK